MLWGNKPMRYQFGIPVANLKGKFKSPTQPWSLPKAQRMIKVFQQYFALSPVVLRYIFQLAVLIALQEGWWYAWGVCLGLGIISREKQKNIAGYVINFSDLYRTA